MAQAAKPSRHASALSRCSNVSFCVGMRCDYQRPMIGASQPTYAVEGRGLVKTFGDFRAVDGIDRSEEHTSELQSLMRISSAVLCLKKKKIDTIKYLIDTYKN